MIGKIHEFDLREGRGYRMSLFYPDNENAMKGKTSEKEDRFIAKFIELTPSKKIIEAINFETSDSKFPER